MDCGKITAFLRSQQPSVLRKIAVAAIFILSLIAFIFTCIWAYAKWFDFEPFIGIFASLATALATFVSLLDLYGIKEEEFPQSAGKLFERLPFLGGFYATFAAVPDMLLWTEKKYAIQDGWLRFRRLTGIEFYFYAVLIHSTILILLLLGYDTVLTCLKLMLTFGLFNSLQIGVYLVAFLIAYPLYRYIVIEPFNKQEYKEKIKLIISISYFEFGLIILLSTFNVAYEVFTHGKAAYLAHVIARDAKPDFIDALGMILFTALLPMIFISRITLRTIGNELMIAWLLLGCLLYAGTPVRSVLLKVSALLKAQIFVG